MSSLYKLHKGREVTVYHNNGNPIRKRKRIRMSKKEHRKIKREAREEAEAIKARAESAE